MSLTRVTITGADDDVSPGALLELSAEFPFVEWGILFSPKRQGTLRYPSERWLGEWFQAAVTEVHARWSAHLCGSVAREALHGDDSFLRGLGLCLTLFDRIQVNGFTQVTRGLVSLIDEYAEINEFILQTRSPESLICAVEAAGACFDSAARVSALWDVSGGKGIMPPEWPGAPRIEDEVMLPLGFAGGIGPGNVADVLKAIGDRDEDFWIDMETGVRTDDRFDLAKVRNVLELAALWVADPKVMF